MNNPHPIPPPRISGVPADQYAARWADTTYAECLYNLSSEDETKNRVFYVRCLRTIETFATVIIATPLSAKKTKGWARRDLSDLYTLARWLDRCIQSYPITD